jgi:hypothetical protein
VGIDMVDLEKEHRKKARELIKKWEKGLILKDKRKENLPELFSFIFIDLYSSGIPREIVEDCVKQIAICLYPPANISKPTYEKVKVENPIYVKGLTYREWLEGWYRDILKEATKAFVEVYPEVKVEGVKKIGSMSHREYKLQRAHADSYPIIDPDSIQLAAPSTEYFDELEKELAKMLEDYDKAEDEGEEDDNV